MNIPWRSASDIVSIDDKNLLCFTPSDITSSELIPTKTDHLLNPIEIGVKKYRHHPSILKIKDKVDNALSFEFEPVAVTAVSEDFSRLNPKKHL